MGVYRDESLLLDIKGSYIVCMCVCVCVCVYRDVALLLDMKDRLNNLFSVVIVGEFNAGTPCLSLHAAIPYKYSEGARALAYTIAY